jgi:DedD protein
MRDTHKLKEKFELSLESSQVVTLTVAGLVVLGGVFVLGVVVGKKLATEQGVASAAPADVLSTADEKTSALDAAQRETAALTFQDALTRPEAPMPLEVPTPPAVAQQKPAAPVAPPAPQAPVAAAQEQVKVEPTPTRTNDAGALKEAFGKAQRVVSEPPPPPAGTWAVQLSASQDKSEAERFSAGLRDKGYAPYLVKAEVSGKGVWYRVRLGRFPNREAAAKYLVDFKRETSMEAFVTQ